MVVSGWVDADVGDDFTGFVGDGVVLFALVVQGDVSSVRCGEFLRVCGDCCLCFGDFSLFCCGLFGAAGGSVSAGASVRPADDEGEPGAASVIGPILEVNPVQALLRQEDPRV